MSPYSWKGFHVLYHATFKSLNTIFKTDKVRGQSRAYAPLPRWSSWRSSHYILKEPACEAMESGSSSTQKSKNIPYSLHYLFINSQHVTQPAIVPCPLIYKRLCAVSPEPLVHLDRNPQRKCSSPKTGLWSQPSHWVHSLLPHKQ